MVADFSKAKAAIDIDAAKAFAHRSPLELDGLANFLRQSIVDAEWDITRAKSLIEAYQAVLQKIDAARKKRP